MVVDERCRDPDRLDESDDLEDPRRARVLTSTSKAAKQEVTTKDMEDFL